MKLFPGNTYRTVSFVLAGLVVLVLSFRSIYSVDLGFHLQAGQWIVENHSFPAKDVFTYTAGENDYIDLNWLYQVILYGTYSLGGSTALVLMNSLFILTAFYFLWKRVGEKSALFLPWLLLLAVLVASASFEIRPHAVSWIFLGAACWQMQKYYDGNQKAIRWLPLIMLLWVNLHSLFILGLIVLACYGISTFRKEKTLCKTFVIYASLSVLACFLNPYGWKGVMHPFQQMQLLQSGNVFKENIRELQSPFDLAMYQSGILNAWFYFDLFILVATGSFLYRFRRFLIHEWLIAIVFMAFAFSAMKNAGYLVFAVTPFIIHRLAEQGKRSQPKPSLLQRFSKQAEPVFWVTNVLLILTVVTNAFYIHYRAVYRFGFGWNGSVLPVEAVDFMKKNALNGKVLNQLDYGGYFEFFTKQKASIDGRLETMGPANFSEQVLALTDDQKKDLLVKYSPQVIVFCYASTPDWISFLLKQPGWRLVHADGNAAIYLKSDYAASVPVLTGEKMTSGVKQYSDDEISSLVNNKSNSLFAGLVRKQYYPDSEMNLTTFCFYYGWFGAAKQFALGAVEHATSGYPDIFLNLGNAFFQLQDKEHSLTCYEKYLRLRKDEQVEKRVQFLKSL